MRYKEYGDGRAKKKFAVLVGSICMFRIRYSKILFGAKVLK